MINKSTNIVDNICVWDGNTNNWQPPENTLMLIQADTRALIWTEVTTDGKITDYVLNESMGIGSIGFTWNGSVLTTNESKPTIPVQPKSTGLQTA